MKQAAIAISFVLSTLVSPPRAHASEVYRCRGGLFTTTPKPDAGCVALNKNAMVGTRGERVFGVNLTDLKKRRKNGPLPLSGRLFETESGHSLSSTTAPAAAPIGRSRRSCGG